MIPDTGSPYNAKPDARQMRVGVIWDGMAFETPVIPAKAGIQSVDSAFPKVWEVDSRFRGNDCGLERPCLADDTTSGQGSAVSEHGVREAH